MPGSHYIAHSSLNQETRWLKSKLSESRDSLCNIPEYKPRKRLAIGSHLWFISINCLDSILCMPENGIGPHTIEEIHAMEWEAWALGEVSSECTFFGKFTQCCIKNSGHRISAPNVRSEGSWKQGKRVLTEGLGEQHAVRGEGSLPAIPTPQAPAHSKFLWHQSL